MIRAILVIYTIIFVAPASAFDGKSAVRNPDQSYLHYKEISSLIASSRLQSKTLSRAAVNSSAPYQSSDRLPAVTVWNSLDTMNQRFTRFRDWRGLEMSERPGFLRRSTWLYPDDGCYARASLTVLHLLQWGFTAPSKIFVFGDLNVDTANSPSGSVSWWYHVAPIVQVGSQKFVLDPALDPRQPTKLEDWLLKMHPNIYSIEVAICQSGTYTPDDSCERVSDGAEIQASYDQSSFLQMEWYRLMDLKRDPVKELGDQPPWLTVVTAGRP